MENFATKKFATVLQNADKFLLELRLQVFKRLELADKCKIILCDIHQCDTCLEYIEDSFNEFDFLKREVEFLKKLQEVIVAETEKVQRSEVDYDAIANELMQRLKKVGNVDIFLEEDFLTLSKKVTDKFSTFVSYDKLYEYFISKKEEVQNVIESYNQKLLDTLISLTPQFLDELRNFNAEQAVSMNDSNGDILSNDIGGKIEKNRNFIISACNSKKVELKKMFDNPRLDYKSNKSDFAIVYRELTILMNDISGGKYDDAIADFTTQVEFEKFINEKIPSLSGVLQLSFAEKDDIKADTRNDIDDSDMKNNGAELFSGPSFEELHNTILSTDNLNSLLVGKAIMEKYLGTFDDDTNRQLEDEYYLLIDRIITLSVQNFKQKNAEPNDPDFPPVKNKSVEIGSSHDDVISLINRGSYFSVLHGIQKQSVAKYEEFIAIGLNDMLNDWRARVNACTSKEAMQQLSVEFLGVLDNFRDYVSMETVNMLMSELAWIKRKLSESSDYGIRYTGNRDKTGVKSDRR